MKFKISLIVFISVIILASVVLFINNQTKRTQVITNPTKMQSCDDTGIFQRLSGTKTKAWGFGTSGNMMFNGSVVCIYDGFGKPTISSIIFSDNNKEAQIYLQTDNSILNQERVAIILPAVHVVQVFDSETKSSIKIYPDAFRDLDQNEEDKEIETFKPNQDGSMIEKTEEARKRKGDLDLTKLEIVNVKGNLLKSIMALFDAINKNDEKLRHSLTYDPKHDDVFDDGEYIFGITKLELDNSRTTAVTKEYDLDKIADDVAIVKITEVRLNLDLTEQEGTGDYIFIKDKYDNKWKVYRYQ